MRIVILFNITFFECLSLLFVVIQYRRIYSTWLIFNSSLTIFARIEFYQKALIYN
jgi:hypothetical protein